LAWAKKSSECGFVLKSRRLFELPANGGQCGDRQERYRRYDGFNPSEAVELPVTKFKNFDEATFRGKSATFGEKRSQEAARFWRVENLRSAQQNVKCDIFSLFRRPLMKEIL
jgi:hypothetical protein